MLSGENSGNAGSRAMTFDRDPEENKKTFMSERNVRMKTESENLGLALQQRDQKSTRIAEH